MVSAARKQKNPLSCQAERANAVQSLHVHMQFFIYCFKGMQRALNRAAKRQEQKERVCIPNLSTRRISACNTQCIRFFATVVFPSSPSQTHTSPHPPCSLGVSR